jgi:hypothetical protein
VTEHEQEVLDAEPVLDEPAPEPAMSTAVARRERRSEVIRPLDAEQLVDSFHAYQQLLPQLLVDSDYQAAEAGKKFVKKSGWRKIATAFDLDVQIVAEQVERDENGRILRAKTTARATAPSGRVMDGDGYCTIDEFTGRRATNPKLENDLRGTAATRAKNRAISDLVGMGEVSAEEAVADHAQPGPAWAEEASAQRKQLALDSLAFLVGDEDVAKDGLVAVKDALGVVPEGIAVALSRIARVVQEKAAA